MKNKKIKITEDFLLLKLMKLAGKNVRVGQESVLKKLKS